MRFLYSRKILNQLRAELNSVQDAMVSSSFIIVDSFWYALLFTLLLAPALPSVMAAIVLFLFIYSACLCVYFSLTKWFKDPKE